MAEVKGTAPDRGGRKGRWRQRLSNLIQDWEKMRNRIEDLLETIDQEQRTGYDDVTLKRLENDLASLRDKRRHTVNQIRDIAAARGLEDFAVEQGFRADLLRDEEPQGNTTTPAAAEGSGRVPGVGRNADTGGGGGSGGGGDTGGGGGGKGGGGGASARAQAIDNRLLGDKGKDYDIVRGPKGSYVARYKFTIDGETFHIGVRIPRGRLGRYGVKEGEGKQLTAAQMKRIRNIGSAEALSPYMRKGDSSVLKSLVRSLNVQYEGQSILNNDGVMAKIIANSLFGWELEEFENQLRTTKWYKNTNAYQREYVTTVSREEKKERQKLYMERVVNKLEDMYGLDWTEHVKGGMEQARKWAQNISSGRWGEPGEGFEFWAERQFDRAAAIQNTPAWIAQQKGLEEDRAYLNRPEEIFENLRSQAMAYLGYDKNNTPRIDRGTLQDWAGRLATGESSQGDWAQFLRGQMKTLHPYFDPNLSFTEQASAYKSIAERTLGDTLDWNDRLLRDFSKLNAQGEPVENRPMSLHDFELKVRQDNRAWKQGTQLFEEGLGIVQALENTFKGIG